VEPDGINPDPHQAAAIDGPSAILVTHAWGLPARMDTLTRLARPHHLTIMHRKMITDGPSARKTVLLSTDATSPAGSTAADVHPPPTGRRNHSTFRAPEPNYVSADTSICSTWPNFVRSRSRSDHTTTRATTGQISTLR